MQRGMPRRLEVGLAALASACLSALVLWPALADFGARLPGGWAAWGQGWAMARLRWTLSGVTPPAVEGPVVLAGWPQLLTGAGLWDLAGPAGAVTLSAWLWLGAGALAVYLAARSLGAGPLAASLGAMAANFNPVVLRATREGWLEWLAVPLVALAFWGAAHPDEGRASWARGALGGLAAAACGLCTPALGVATSLMACWIALGRGGARVAAVALPALGGSLAVGWGYRGGAPMPRPMVEKILAYVDPVDLAAPFWVWRGWGLHAGLSLVLGLVAAALLLRARRGAALSALGGASALGLLLSMGPALQWGGVRVQLGSLRVPLPAVLPELLLEPGVLVNWKVALVPALVALGLLLSQVEARRFLAPALLLLLGEWALAPRTPTVDGRVPVAIEQLAEGEGLLLQLPLELAAVEGDEGRGFKALYWQGVHGRPLLTGMAPVWRSRLFNEPVVVLAANAQVESERWAVPPAGPASVFRELGVVGVIVDRSDSAPGTLALLDLLMAKAFESPQRDLAGGVDLYAPSREDPEGFPVGALPLTEVGDAPPDWRAPDEYLRRWR